VKRNQAFLPAASLTLLQLACAGREVTAMPSPISVDPASQIASRRFGAFLDDKTHTLVVEFEYHDQTRCSAPRPARRVVRFL
jgi:hypothetical protein